jgi:hypothetical protein
MSPCHGPTSESQHPPALRRRASGLVVTHHRHAGSRTPASDASATARHAEFVGIQRRAAVGAPSERARRHRRARERWRRRVVLALAGAASLAGGWAVLEDSGGVRTDVVRWIDEAANGPGRT